MERLGLVTGAASGIGRAITERFVADGMRVVAADIDTAAAYGNEREVGEAVAVEVGEARRRREQDRRRGDRGPGRGELCGADILTEAPRAGLGAAQGGRPGAGHAGDDLLESADIR